MANGPTMPASNETQTSMALRVLLYVATSTVLIFVAHAGTIISSAAQNTSSNVILINDGDSLSTTFGSSDRKTFMLYALSALTPVPRSVNVAVNGETLATMVSNFSAHVGVLYDPKYRLVVHILAGTNDIRAASSAATIYSLLQTYVNDVHALGSNAKVIVGVNLVQCDIYDRANELGVLEALNAHIIAGWNVAQGSGGLGADGIANYWVNTTIGPGNYNGSTFCNYPNSYSKDGAHPTDLAMSIMGSIEAAAVQPLLP
jgi:hypothetical protein